MAYASKSSPKKRAAVHTSVKKSAKRSARKPVRKTINKPAFSFSSVVMQFKSLGFFNFKKFSKATLLTVVALIECVILLVLSTYSWIESSSSLTIRGVDNLYVDNELKSDIIQLGAYESDSIVDLHQYYQYTSRFMLARASSANGKDFFLPTKNIDESSTVARTYRAGDTTDYNINYYCFDFNIVNDVGVNYNYYFAENIDNLITFDDSSVDSEVKLSDAEKTTIKNAMRISISSDGADPKVYSFNVNSENRHAITAAPCTYSTNVSLKTISASKYVENKNDDYTAVFIAGQNINTKITVRLWMEDLADGITPALIKKLTNTPMTINLGFRMADSGAKIITFEDYTVDSFNESNYGNNYTLSGSSGESMFFHYSTTSGSDRNFKMVKTSSDKPGCTVWKTEIALSKEQLNSINQGKSYFFYGTAADQSTTTEKGLCSWHLKAGDMTLYNKSYTFKSFGIIEAEWTYGGKTLKLGYGEWEKGNNNTQLTTVYFDDKNTANTNNAFNSNGFRFINATGNGCMYVSNYSAASGNMYVPSILGTTYPIVSAINMYYNAEDDLWCANVPSTWVINATSDSSDDFLFFDYVSSMKYRNSYVTVRYKAPNDTTVRTLYKYTGLGYATDTAYGKSTLETLKSTTNDTVIGTGTWGEVEPVNLSTELIDTTSSSAWRYQVSYGSNKYYMAPSCDNMFLTAYLPVESRNQQLTFTRYTTNAISSIGATFAAGYRDDMTDESLMSSSDTYYITGNSGNTGTGQWHIVVLTDETIDNIVNDIMSDTSITTRKLRYSTDGENYYDMTKLDNFRWYTGDFGNNVETVYIRWTTYSDAEHFDYEINPKSGIYLSITE